MHASHIAAAWLRTRRALRLSPRQLAARRSAQWQKLQPALARTPALADVAWGAWEDVPITEVTALRGDYAAWNSVGLNASTLDAMADAAEQGRDVGLLSAGWSTGKVRNDGRRNVAIVDTVGGKPGGPGVFGA